MSDQEDTKPTTPSWIASQPMTNGATERPKRARRTQAQMAEAEARGEKVRRGAKKSIAPVAPTEPPKPTVYVAPAMPQEEHPLSETIRWYAPPAVAFLVLFLIGLSVVILLRH